MEILRPRPACCFHSATSLGQWCQSALPSNRTLISNLSAKPADFSWTKYPFLRLWTVLTTSCTAALVQVTTVIWHQSLHWPFRFCPFLHAVQSCLRIQMSDYITPLIKTLHHLQITRKTFYKDLTATWEPPFSAPSPCPCHIPVTPFLCPMACDCSSSGFLVVLQQTEHGLAAGLLQSFLPRNAFPLRSMAPSLKFFIFVPNVPVSVRPTLIKVPTYPVLLNAGVQIFFLLPLLQGHLKKLKEKYMKG